MDVIINNLISMVNESNLLEFNLISFMILYII